MAEKYLDLEGLEYFKDKQDAANGAEFAKAASVPTKVSQLENDLGFQTQAQLSTAISQALASVLTWRGVKATTGDLPSSGNKVGDVWHVSADSAEYAWDGTEWQALGGLLQASVAWGDITGKPSTFPPAAHTHDAADVTGLPTYSPATPGADGLMSAEDKEKLDGVEEGANAYSHPASAAGAKASGLYKVATDAQGHVTGAVAVTKQDIVALGIPGQDTNTTYGSATAESPGLMSAADKSKLDGISTITTTEIDALFS